MQGFSVDRANTVLYCKRWSETVTFYRDVIGFGIEFENDWFVEFRVGAAAFLSIADAQRASIDAVDGQGVTLTFHTPDLTAAHSSLAEQGVDVSPLKHRWGADVFYCNDPEGHRIEFWT